MQVKTINKLVRKKMEDWLKSLPKKLREDVRPQVLVSGGCIASMFLQEDVNDFDIYIQDQDVLFKLAKHYATNKNRSALDGRKKNKIIKKYFPNVAPDGDGKYGYTEWMHRGQVKGFNMELYSNLMSLAHDQIRLDIPDSGLMFKINPDTLIKKPYQIAFLSPNAISLTNKVQIILRFSGSPEEIHKNFDYVHATNYWTFDDGVVTNTKALISLLTKQLMYQGSLYPLTSIIRSKKFILRGWKISAGEYLKIMWQISELDLRDTVRLKDQLIGVDIAYFASLIEELNQREPKDWNNQFINDSIDLVFNEVVSED